MKNKVIKSLLLIILALVVGILLFSIIWPLFHKKTQIEDIQTVSFKPYLNTDEDITHPISNERVLCIDDNLEALVWRLKIINSAQNRLEFATFSFNDDRSGRSIMAALYDAAQRGVHVRMAIDGLSSFLYLKKSDYFNTLANHKNIEIKIYNPINLLKPWRINYRMHDKYIIADNNIYMLGGRNTKNLSLGNYQEKQDIDRDVVVYNTTPVENDSLHQVRNYFENIWDAKFSKRYYAKKIKDEKKAQSNLKMYYENLKEDFPSAFDYVDWYNDTYSVNAITLLHNPINNGNKAPVLWDSLIELSKNAKKVLIQTPYIMCNNKMYDDLASLNKDNRDISFITNSVENGANICGCADYLNQKKKIRKNCSRIYEYNDTHSSHAKTLLIDDNISVIGSFNYDMRSAYIDTELMLVIESPSLNAYLRDLNEINMDKSRCVYQDGSITYGDNYIEKDLPLSKKILYGFLRVVSVPVRHLL